MEPVSVAGREYPKVAVVRIAEIMNFSNINGYL